MYGGVPHFGDDLDFLQRHTDTMVLSEPGGAGRLALCPELQGRIATSATADGAGRSFGWLNRAAIGSKQLTPHMNVYGGEDRFWLGPEGGPFSLFFAPGAPQDLAHWQTPAPIDSEPFTLVDAGADWALLRKTMRLINAAGTVFDLDVEREVRIYAAARTWSEAGLKDGGGASVVGFESRNRITNRGEAPWRHDTGLVSIWIAGTFPPSPSTIIVIPVRSGPETVLGPVVNDRYFGAVPPDRLVPTDTGVYFRGDGRHRAKIGVSPLRACSAAVGSYDVETELLTLVTYSRPERGGTYVNALWGDQSDPYCGDVVNGYNDGPPAPGQTALGPFYELESSSPGAPLAPGESAEHVHRTLHFLGAPEVLDDLARASLGVRLADVAGAFSRSPQSAPQSA